MDRSGILFGLAFGMLGIWALGESAWLATGCFVVAALYVATAFSRRLDEFLRGRIRRHRPSSTLDRSRKSG
ncbi:hypothetical protein [Nocardioides terrigena]|uniref:hypothetical protein n=1 Tax=Nocardioides terrigena TaxID=424797 RepID=UPI000D3036B9|nr:hypothetical protein [Nocardioides terrigena]